jgi:hypothetical protein
MSNVGMTVSVSVSVGVELADREQRQAQVTDLGQEAVQRRLVGDRTDDDGLAELVAGDTQALEPGRPERGSP